MKFQPNFVGWWKKKDRHVDGRCADSYSHASFWKCVNITGFTHEMKVFL